MNARFLESEFTFKLGWFLAGATTWMIYSALFIRALLSFVK